MAVIANDISKDIGSVYARLFDSQLAINTESKHMLFEFETKRGDREIRKMSESVEMVSAINTEVFPSIVKLSKENLPNLNEKVRTALEKTDEIISTNESFQMDLSVEKIELEEEWDKFQAWLVVEREKVDTKFVKQMSELRQNFSEIEGISSAGEQPKNGNN